MRYTPEHRPWDWTPWFAWQPVPIGRTWVWLEYVERIRVWEGDWPEWNYRFRRG